MSIEGARMSIAGALDEHRGGFDEHRGGLRVKAPWELDSRTSTPTSSPAPTTRSSPERARRTGTNRTGRFREWPPVTRPSREQRPKAEPVEIPRFARSPAVRAERLPGTLLAMGPGMTTNPIGAALVLAFSCVPSASCLQAIPDETAPPPSTFDGSAGGRAQHRADRGGVGADGLDPESMDFHGDEGVRRPRRRRWRARGHRIHRLCHRDHSSALLRLPRPSPDARSDVGIQTDLQEVRCRCRAQGLRRGRRIHGLERLWRTDQHLLSPVVERMQGVFEDRHAGIGARVRR